jgi:hypothetical protein
MTLITVRNIDASINSQKTFSQWRISDIYFGDEWLQLENISIELQINLCPTLLPLLARK